MLNIIYTNNNFASDESFYYKIIKRNIQNKINVTFKININFSFFKCLILQVNKAPRMSLFLLRRCKPR